MYLRRSGKKQTECCREMGLSEKTSCQFRRGVIQSISSSAYVKWKQYLSDAAAGVPHVAPALTEATAADKAAADTLRAEINGKCHTQRISRSSLRLKLSILIFAETLYRIPLHAVYILSDCM